MKLLTLNNHRLAPNLLLVLAIAGCSHDTAPPTITLTPSTGPQVRNPPIYQDDAYSFEIQDFGHSVIKLSDFALEPGVFVFSKSKQQWMRIDQISTAGAKWGYTPIENHPITRQISWDFRPLAKQESVQIPLNYQETIVDLPDAITFDSQHNTYKFAFDALAPDAADVSTILLFNRTDLDHAFEK